MGNLKGIVFFDLDDTLVDTTKFNRDAVNYCLNYACEKNIDLSKIDLLNVYNEIYPKFKSNTLIMNKLIESFQEKFSNILTFNQAKDLGSELKIVYEKYMDEHFKDFMPKKAFDVIENFYFKGYKIGLISQGSPQFQKLKFDSLHLNDLFDDSLIFFNEIKTDKFYQNIKNQVFEKYGQLELIMIGDREELDILLPKSIGFTPIRILGNSRYQQVKNNSDYLEFGNFQSLYDNFEKLDFLK